MEKVFTQTYILKPRSDAELRAIIRRFEEKWQRRRRAHRFASIAL